jgi:hypothetical protein
MSPVGTAAHRCKRLVRTGGLPDIDRALQHETSANA